MARRLNTRPTADTGKLAREGVGYGVVAGILMGIVAIIGGAASGMATAVTPFRYAASIVMGEGAFEAGTGTALLVGTLVHLVLALAFGAIYGLLHGRAGVETRTSYARQSVLGLLFGSALWIVNFQIIARIIWPQFLATNQLAMWALHAFAFGLPLALMLAAAERRVPTPTAAPRAV
jgi:hypothetical protein